jgi:hypothetical protein
MRLPLPDPHEAPFSEPDGSVEFGAPTIVYTNGRPTPEAERIANAIIAARPGVLFLHP